MVISTWWPSCVDVADGGAVRVPRPSYVLHRRAGGGAERPRGGAAPYGRRARACRRGACGWPAHPQARRTARRADVRMRHVRLPRPVVGALALLGQLLPIAAPAAALPGGVAAAPIDGATEDPSSEDSRPAPPADILRDEAAGSGATAMRWLERSLLGRSLEDIARAMRARAGLPTTE